MWRALCTGNGANWYVQKISHQSSARARVTGVISFQISMLQPSYFGNQNALIRNLIGRIGSGEKSREEHFESRPSTRFRWLSPQEDGLADLAWRARLPSLSGLRYQAALRRREAPRLRPLQLPDSGCLCTRRWQRAWQAPSRLASSPTNASSVARWLDPRRNNTVEGFHF